MSSIYAQRTTGAAVQAVRAQTCTKPTILIAEDSADGRDMMATLLGLKGYDVFEAEDGLQAVEREIARDGRLETTNRVTTKLLVA